jgi:hypothetical protein
VDEFGRSLRDGGCGVCGAGGTLVEKAVDRAGATAASSPRTAPTATATAARPTTPDQLRVGPPAIARLTAPTKRPKTSVSATMTAIGACVASVMARVETSQASTAPNSTTTPAVTCMDRS